MAGHNVFVAATAADWTKPKSISLPPHFVNRTAMLQSCKPLRQLTTLSPLLTIFDICSSSGRSAVGNTGHKLVGELYLGPPLPPGIPLPPLGRR